MHLMNKVLKKLQWWEMVYWHFNVKEKYYTCIQQNAVMHSFTNPRNVITDTDWFNVQVLVSKLISKSLVKIYKAV